MAEKSKRKILYVITKSVWGGAGKYVYDLAVNMPKEKFDIYVAAGGSGPLAQKIKETGIAYHEIINFQRDISILKEIFSYFEILLLLLKIRPDIIHVNSSKAGGIVGIAALDYKILTLNFKVKTIFTAHGWAFHEDRPAWQIIIIKLLSALTCFFYSKIICVSEYDRESATKKRVAPKRKLITIHNGIDYRKISFLDREESQKKLIGETSSFIIGTIAEWTKNKGQKYLIEAVKKLRDKNYNLKAVLIGWGEEQENYKLQITNYKLENEIFLIDNLPHAASYLKAFDIFVLPSTKEGLPYTLLEAGLAGLPVVATKVGGIPEIIGHDQGLLVEPGNTEDLAGKIEAFINKPNDAKLMGQSLWQKVMREFSLEKMLNATIAAYEK